MMVRPTCCLTNSHNNKLRQESSVLNLRFLSRIEIVKGRSISNGYMRIDWRNKRGGERERSQSGERSDAIVVHQITVSPVSWWISFVIDHDLLIVVLVWIWSAVFHRLSSVEHQVQYKFPSLIPSFLSFLLPFFGTSISVFETRN